MSIVCDQPAGSSPNEQSSTLFVIAQPATGESNVHVNPGPPGIGSCRVTFFATPGPELPITNSKWTGSPADTTGVDVVFVKVRFAPRHWMSANASGLPSLSECPSATLWYCAHAVGEV